MPNNRNRRVTPTQMNENTVIHNALKGINGYKPVNNAFSLEQIEDAKQAMEAARAVEAQAQAALDGARDRAAAAEWAFHDKILGAKDQVKAQFGKNSDEIQALGLKKDNERKPRALKPKTGDAAKKP